MHRAYIATAMILDMIGLFVIGRNSANSGCDRDPFGCVKIFFLTLSGAC